MWPAPQYLNEAHTQLSDTQYYTRIDKDHTPDTALEINTFLCSLKYKLDHELDDFLSPVSQLRTPIFYLLPKIHKPSVPGRPTIFGCDSLTSRLSIFLDYYLKPIVSTLPSFIKDTNHFLMGTAMGIAFAPDYANIYMGYFEETALSKAPNNLQPLIWKRFIDDIVFIWTHGGTALQEFYDYLNTIHSTIKFEISHSNQEINFVDTTIFFKHGTKLESTLFVKPADTCSLLHVTSFHPDSCKSSVIYSQALRYCSIITDHTKLKEQLDILKENLFRRGYQLSQMHKNFRKAIQYSQSELLNRSNFPETKKTNFTIYHTLQ